jgi:hypothetical protein
MATFRHIFIGNVLGKTVLVDDSFFTSDTRTMVRVLVEINVNKCLFESMDLKIPF